MVKALITGVTGQDGSLLAHYLLQQDYQIIAPVRSSSNYYRLEYLGIWKHANLKLIPYINFLDFDDIIKFQQFNEIYHLAAISHVGESHLNSTQITHVNYDWTECLLNSICSTSPDSKFFFASSGEIFHNDFEAKVSELSVKKPNNPYGVSKYKAHQLVQRYRKEGLFACNGILFNHESFLRDKRFVSKKICSEVARIVKNGGSPLSMGNLDAKKDWGYAQDFVPYFQTILTQEIADDYVLATGELHSVKDMVNLAFSALDYPINWSGKGKDCIATNTKNEIVVNINPKYFRPLDNRFIAGDNAKAQKDLNFKKLTLFCDWVKSMTLEEYNQLA